MSKFTLRDLKPQTAKFKLEAFPDREFSLKKFSLAARVWCDENLGEERLKNIFAKMYIPDIARVVHHLLEDNTLSLQEFMENVCTHDDRVHMAQALLTTIGLSQPLIDKIAKETEEAQAEGNALAPPTGAKSTT